MRGLEIEIVPTHKNAETKDAHQNAARKLFGKTVFITGAARGVGKEIAVRLAKDGANIVVAGKTDKPNPSKPGTILTTVQEVEVVGGRGFAVVMDIREESQIKSAVDSAVKKFGGIDILINNATVISLTDTEDTDMKNYDLMGNVNARGTFLLTKTCLPHLKNSTIAHVLNITPPINLKTVWLTGRVPYAMAKYGMSMCVIGMAQEFRGYGVSVNGLWARTIIETDDIATSFAKQVCRKPQIMADAAYAIFTMDPRPIGEFFLDDEALMQVGITKLGEYCVDPAYINQLVLNAFVDDSVTEIVKKPFDVTILEVEKSETGAQMQKIIDKFESLFDESLVQSVQRVFQFIVSGDKEKQLYIDLKTGSGSFKMGESPETPDLTINMDEQVFYETFVKGIKPTFAFRNGRITLQGDKNSIKALDKIIVSSVAKL